MKKPKFTLIAGINGAGNLDGKYTPVPGTNDKYLHSDREKTAQICFMMRLKKRLLGYIIILITKKPGIPQTVNLWVIFIRPIKIR